MPSQPLLETNLEALSLVRRGKVRDVYAVDDAIVLVATDRISAFDYVLGSGRRSDSRNPFGNAMPQTSPVAL